MRLVCVVMFVEPNLHRGPEKNSLNNIMLHGCNEGLPVGHVGDHCSNAYHPHVSLLTEVLVAPSTPMWPICLSQDQEHPKCVFSLVSLNDQTNGALQGNTHWAKDHCVKIGIWTLKHCGFPLVSLNPTPTGTLKNIPPDSPQ